MKNETANIIIIVFFFLVSFSITNTFNDLTSYILSIAFLIAGVYGVICIFKKQKFLF
jgi:hypothetical protein